MRKVDINVYSFDELSLNDQVYIIHTYYNNKQIEYYISDELLNDYKKLREFVKTNLMLFIDYYKNYEFWCYHSVFMEKDEYEVMFWLDFR